MDRSDKKYSNFTFVASILAAVCNKCSLKNAMSFKNFYIFKQLKAVFIDMHIFCNVYLFKTPYRYCKLQILAYYYYYCQFSYLYLPDSYSRAGIYLVIFNQLLLRILLW